MNLLISGQTSILKKALNSILNDQNSDGGFCESKHIKYKKNIKNIINHVISQPRHIRFWSILMNLNFSRYKHRNIFSYWTQPYIDIGMSQILGILFLDY